MTPSLKRLADAASDRTSSVPGTSPKEGSGRMSATAPPAPGCRVRRSSCILSISDDKRSTLDASSSLALFLGGGPALPRRQEWPG